MQSMESINLELTFLEMVIVLNGITSTLRLKIILQNM